MAVRTTLGTTHVKIKAGTEWPKSGIDFKNRAGASGLLSVALEADGGYEIR